MSSRLKTLNSLFNSPLSIARFGSAGLKLTLAMMIETKGYRADDLKTRGFLRTQSERPMTDWDGEPIEQMTMQNGIAVIPLKGTMVMDVPTWIKEMGYVDSYDVVEDIQNAQMRGARGIAMDIDSPGGATYAGHQIFDALSEVRAAGIPVMSYASGDMASAAFQSALPSNVIFASPYSNVGSIGTYSVVVDDEEFWKEMGINFEVIASGKFKGMGINSLTPEQRQFLQDSVNTLGNQFRANVSTYRKSVSRDDMEGQWYNGRVAAEKGFVDGIKNNLQKALDVFSEMIESSNK